jgi:hypothetical protein
MGADVMFRLYFVAIFFYVVSQNAECAKNPASADNFIQQKQICNETGCFVLFRGGAWFEVMYPAGFVPRVIQKSAAEADKADAVAFSSSDKLVEFYIYSPQWNGVAPGIEINPSTERLESEKSTKSKGGIITWFTIKSRKGEYVRSYQDFKSESIHWVIGIKYKDKNAYARYKEQYLFFKKSLRQFSD